MSGAFGRSKLFPRRRYTDAQCASEDIRAIDEELQIPIVYVLNKCLNQFSEVEAFESQNFDNIIGKIPFIPSIYGKNPLSLKDEVGDIFSGIIEKILSRELSSPAQRWERVLRCQETLQTQLQLSTQAG